MTTATEKIRAIQKDAAPRQEGRHMPHFPFAHRFMPSDSARRLLPFCRHERSATGLAVPELMKISAFGWDAAGFSLVVVAELVGMAALYYFNPNIQLWHMGVLVGIDLLGAILFHSDQRVRSLIEAWAFILPEKQKRDGRRTLNRNLTIGLKLSKAVGLALIGFSLFMKIIGIIYFRVPTMFAVGIYAAYGVAALLHVKVTGYFLAGAVAKLLQVLSRRKYQKDCDHGAVNPKYSINAWQTMPIASPNIAANPFPLTEAPAHRIWRSSDGSGGALLAGGMLTDADVLAAVDLQQPDLHNALVIAVAGKRLQLEQVPNSRLKIMPAACL